MSERRYQLLDGMQQPKDPNLPAYRVREPCIWDSKTGHYIECESRSYLHDLAAALNAAEQAAKERKLLAKMADLFSDEDWQGSYAMHAVKNKLLAEYAALQAKEPS